MSRHLRLLLVLAASLALLVAGSSGPVHSDGIAIVIEAYEIEMPAQQAIIVWDEEKGHEDLILSVELLGSPEAAWVVPVPALPEVETARPDWFLQLSYVTKPIVEYRTETIYREAGGPITVGEEVEVEVEVISREEVGVYDVSILSADKADALLEWLHDNGYPFPEEGGPILDAYVEEGGWFFVAARVLPDGSDQLAGTVHPLWFSFDTQQPIYPMRLTALLGEPVDVLIYVLAEHRMEAKPVKFSTEFAGELKLFSPASEDNADLRELLSNRRYYVTKLHEGALSPGWMTQDFTFEQAESDEAYRQVVYHTRYVYLSATEPSSTEVVGGPTASAVPTEHPKERPPMDDNWLILGVGLGALGVLAVLALVRRRRSRRRPEDDQEA